MAFSCLGSLSYVELSMAKKEDSLLDYDLIKKLAKKDPKKAERYQAALIETGTHQERLNALRTKIQKELKQVGR